MQGCGYDRGVVAAVTRTFLARVRLHQWCVGEKGWAADRGLGRVCSLFRASECRDRVSASVLTCARG